MRVLADESQVERMVESLAQAVRRDVGSSGRPWGIVGIRSRGDVLARRLANKLGVADVGVLDFTLYRDDLSNAGSQPVVQTTDIPFDVDGLDIVLVDDVLMTGRSIRAALQSLMDLGRPGRVWLAVLVDRGGRELPIAADFHALDLSGRWVQGQAGSTHETLRAGERVEVKLIPTDDRDAIEVRSADERGEG